MYTNPEGTVREERADPADDPQMNAKGTQINAKIAVVYRIESPGEVKEDNIHWLTCIHKLRHPLLSEKVVGQTGKFWGKTMLRV